MPLHVRAGAVLPFGPVKQYVEEQVEQPLTLVVFPGADGTFALYEDDGRSFDYRKGAWMGIDMAWRNADRHLTLQLTPGSRMLAPARRAIDIRVAGEKTVKTIVFEGKGLEVRL
jgi:alpha-glucosidase (family GH31 glycosyl hydrolase)